MYLLSPDHPRALERAPRNVSLFCPLPSVDLIKTSGIPSSRELNARNFPSGDIFGDTAGAVLAVMRTAAPPFSGTFHKSSSLTNTTSPFLTEGNL